MNFRVGGSAKNVNMTRYAMKKTKKVTIEYEDEILTVEGAEAEKWQKIADSLSALAFTRGFNEEIHWKKFKKLENPGVNKQED